MKKLSAPAWQATCELMRAPEVVAQLERALLPAALPQNLSLAIQRCECFGLLGPNGAGEREQSHVLEDGCFRGPCAAA